LKQRQFNFKFGFGFTTEKLQRKTFQTEGGGEALEQVAQRSCGCPLPVSVQGQVGWSPEQPGLVEDVPAHGRGIGTRLSLRSLPTENIL